MFHVALQQLQPGLGSDPRPPAAGTRRWTMVALDNLIRLFSVARGMFALLGLAAVLVVALPAPRDALLKEVAPLVPTVQAAAAAEPHAQPAELDVPAGPVRVAQQETAHEREQRAVAEFIARRYRVAEA